MLFLAFAGSSLPITLVFIAHLFLTLSEKVIISYLKLFLAI